MEIGKIFMVRLVMMVVLAMESAVAQPGNDHSSQVFLDIPYKQISADSVINLDIFLPDDDSLTAFPVVVIIHGGGWAEGDKTLDSLYYMRRLKSKLLENRIAVVSINYRLISKTIHLPAPVEDCKDAIRWLRSHADNFRLDTSNVGVWGGSAGGHLALLTAYTSNDQFAGDPKLSAYSARVNFAIDNFGPTNLNTLFRLKLGWLGTLFFKLFYHDLYRIRERLVFAMTGLESKGNKKEAGEICTFNSPINYVASGNAVPTIIFHGTKDNVVPISQSEELKEALDNTSVRNEFIVVPDGDHGFNNIPHSELDALIDQCVVFVKQNVNRQ